MKPCLLRLIKETLLWIKNRIIVLNNIKRFSHTCSFTKPFKLKSNYSKLFIPEFKNKYINLSRPFLTSKNYLMKIYYLKILTQKNHTQTNIAISLLFHFFKIVIIYKDFYSMLNENNTKANLKLIHKYC